MEAEDILIDSAVVSEYTFAAAVIPADALAQGDPQSQPMDVLLRGLAVGRVYFFVALLAASALGAYLNVHFIELGITPTQLGILGSMTAIVGLIAMPIWSAAADARQWHRAILVFATITFGFGTIAYLSVVGFWSAMAVAFVISILRAPIPIILDSSVVSLARAAGASYARQRVWATIGIAAGGIVASWLVVRLGFASIIWLQVLVVGIMCTALSLLLPIERSRDKVEYLLGFRVLLRSRKYRGLVVFMIGLGIFTSINVAYGVLHILSIGGSPALISMMFLLAGVFEVVGVLLSDTATRRAGPTGTLVIAGIGLATLMAVAALSSSPLFYIALVAIGAIFSGSIWGAAPPLSMQDVPLQLRATAMGIMLAAFFGAGFAIGSLIGGVVLELIGGGAPFIVGAVFLLSATAYFRFAASK